MNCDDWQYLGFEWNGKYYVYTCFPFGLSVACWAFTKLMREPVRYWRSQGMRLLHYLDDFCGGHQSFQHAVALATRMVSDLQTLGFFVNFVKSVLNPSHTLKMLGLIIDTELGQFRVPEAKWVKLKAALEVVRRYHEKVTKNQT
eukprot:Lithocolla_globosa_v1_NODE_9038_length_755_cov_1.215714.p1 type:complete len:144 gc:universal NODE_9038_length_755_cov_1.215714:503-72(-)